MTIVTQSHLDTTTKPQNTTKMSPRKTQFPDFTPELENKIKLWIQKAVLTVVMTPAGNLRGVVFDEQQTIQLPEWTFDAYLDDSLDLIKNYFATTDFDSEDGEDDNLNLIYNVFPMFESDKDDGGFVSDLYYELRYMVFGKTWREMRANMDEDEDNEEDEEDCEVEVDD